MNLHTGKAFRQQVSDCMEQRAESVFSVCDGVVSEPQARSLPELSPSPFVARQWPSVSAALADGKSTVDQVHARCVRSLLAEIPAHALGWLAVDATPEERSDAHTSEDRGSIPVSNVPLAGTPISSGWMVSVVGLLPEQASRWVPPLDIPRIMSEQTAVGVALDQRRQRTPLCGTRNVILVADRWSGTPDMLRACREWGDRVLIRLKSTRKRSRQPVRRFTRGRPPIDGPLVQGTRPDTPCDPSATWQTTDQEGSVTQVSRFEDVPVQQDRDLILSVIRVERSSARGTTRDPRVRWFLALDDVGPVEHVPPRDRLRFSEDHRFRFLTQDVLWLRAHVRTPEPFVRWRWIVALAFTQVSLARPLGLHALLPWEATGRSVTPRQIRRVMPTMVSLVGTPVRATHAEKRQDARKAFVPSLRFVTRSCPQRAPRSKHAQRLSRPALNLLALFIGLVFLWAEPALPWLCSGSFCLNIKTIRSMKMAK
jgi:hypothetical protein